MSTPSAEASLSSAPREPAEATTLIYVIGVEPHLTRALRADYPDCVVQHRAVLRRGQCRRHGARPSLVLVGSSWVCLELEMDVIWASWGTDVMVVSVDGGIPFARAWQHARLRRIVEIGPGFLTPLLASNAN
jgi:hypothetical protein